jgi:hypothetical protein
LGDKNFTGSAVVFGAIAPYRFLPYEAIEIGERGFEPLARKS